MHVLSNGLTAVAVGGRAILLALGSDNAIIGSRSEPDSTGSLASSRMVFKGAGSRDTRQIAEAIEDVSS